MLSIGITKATVLLSFGADKVTLETEFPSPYPKISNQFLSLNFETEKDKAIEYIRKYFGLEPEVINIRQ